MQIVLLIAFIATFLWSVYLYLQLRKTRELFENLTRVKSGPLSEVLATLVKAQDASKKEFSELYEEISRIDDEKKFAIQKVGVVRFSPFGKEEFEQSFAIALLDREQNGLVLTNIHTASRSRLYTKMVKRGKGEIELSPEEQKAVQLANK